ncbi:MAG TPA: hypothetical protein VKA55_01775 [Gammaproteobacteria bacterium]|nr:hypothetical protein [Gammaproteobacteria bacterium]
MTDQPEPGWEAATWEGSRRAQVRRGLRLTPRQRLEAMVALSETAERLAESPEAVPEESPDVGGHGGPGRP